MSHWDIDDEHPDRWSGVLVSLALTLAFIGVLIVLVVFAQMLFPDFHGMNPHGMD